jgi:16S rRNA processing protein RimM
VPVAVIEGVFGLRGELKCRPSSAGEALLEPGTSFWLDDRGVERVELCGVRRHRGRLLVRFEGVEDAGGAARFGGRQLHVPRAAVPLEDGEFLDEDLIGLRLIDAAGRELGCVAAVEHYPAGDYFVVGPEKALVPMVRAFIGAIDLAAGTIAVSLPQGLLDPSLAEEA